MDSIVAETRTPSKKGEPWIVAGLEIPSFENALLEEVVHCIEALGLSPEMHQELDEKGHLTCKYMVHHAIALFVNGLSTKLTSSKLNFSLGISYGHTSIDKMLGTFQSDYSNLKAAGENEIVSKWLDAMHPRWRENLEEARQDLDLVPA